MTAPVAIASTPRAHAVVLTADAERDVHALTAAAKPLEGCGYLVAREGRIVEARATPNVHPEPETRFAVDPLAYMELEDELEGTGREVVGVVHSHPFTHAVPSDTDRAHAQPGWWYLIHGFPPERPEGELRAWRLGDGGSFQEHPLETLPW